MKIGLEKKKLPNNLIGYLLTLLLVVYFMANPLAHTALACYRRGQPQGQRTPPSLVGDFDQNEKLAA
jgi:hypothetical protein